MEWDVKEEMVDLLAGHFAPDAEFDTEINAARLRAVAVLQYCSLRDMSLFEFFGKFEVQGLRLIPVRFPSGVEVTFNDPPAWQYLEWKMSPNSATRLECLRMHIREVKAWGEGREWSGRVDYLVELEQKEAKLARIVEPVPTLGMVADDVAVNEPAPTLAPPSVAEQADIAAVLADPKTAAPVVDASPRKDAQGRALLSEVTLAELYECGQRIGINRIAVQELACEKLKLRTIDDLSEAAAVILIRKMKAQAAAV